MTDLKVIERIGKLLRLAAPSSGTSEHERANAALEAAKLIDEHSIAMQSSTPNVEPKKSRIVHGAWIKTQALDHCSCSNCGQLISPRDVVWLRVVRDHDREFRHNADPCRPVS